MGVNQSRLRGVETRAPWLAIALGVVYVVLPDELRVELFYDSAVLVLVIIAALGWRRGEGRDRRLPMFISGALAGFLTGDAITLAYVWQGLEPWPSIADAGYLIGYASFIAAGAQMAAEGRRVRDRTAWLDAGVLTVVAGLLVWRVLMQPYLDQESESVLYLLLTFVYPLASVAVLGFLFVFLFSPTTRDRRSNLFAAGALVTMVADLYNLYQELKGTIDYGSWLDFGWIAGYTLIAMAATTVRDHDRPATDDTGLGRGRLICTLLAVLVPQGVILMELRERGLLELGTIAVAVGVAIASGVMVTWRMFRLLGRVRAVEQRRGAERLAGVIHHSTDSIFLIDEQFRVTFASPAAAQLVGRDLTACRGADLRAWFVGEAAAVPARLETLLGMPNGAVVPVEGAFRVDTGALTTVDGTACNLLADPDVAAIVVTLRDVSERHRLEAQLERRAFHDSLTGLPNRSLFVDRIDHALVRLQRSPGAGLAVAFIDLDDFKAVNDGMGHSVGDELLTKVADRLTTCVRAADTIARFGGDEFAVLLEDVTSAEQVKEFAERVIEVLRVPMDVGGLSLGVPASIGVAFAMPESTSESLMRDADIAMYGAKANGKGRVVLFDDQLRALAHERLSLKVDLPRALAAGQFELAYQPIFEVGDATPMRGCEALLRWNHPTRGVVPPLDFIPLAEQSGDIVQIGLWVLDQACQQAVIWNRRSMQPLSMSVNVSAVQLHHGGFAADVARILEATGLPGELLTLEITESMLIEQRGVEAIFDALRMLGVGIAIDDFGTGYSSLSYLKRLPVTAVKIDRSFVMDLASSGDLGLVRSIISIAGALGLSTVAEGVESAQQLDLLASVDCRLAQGFHLGRPATVSQIDQLLDSAGTLATAGQRPTA